MSFINSEKVAIARRLKSAHRNLPRATELRLAFQNCVESYYLSQTIGGLEVRGLMVTGKSRVGKSRELKELIGDFNASETLMPNERPARIVSCLLSRRVTFKDLGIITLKTLGYNIQSNRTQGYIWERVLYHAEMHGVIGIHYDECQHVFYEGAKSNQIFLDSFKSMMKEPKWPLMMILSGVPSLSEYVRSYEQLDKLVDPVHFSEVKLSRDKNTLVKLLFDYADLVEIDIKNLMTEEFLARLDHACNHRLGLIIELLIDTLTEAKLNGKTQLKVKDFAEQFALRSGIPKSYNPFTTPDFLEAFDPEKLFELTR